MLPKVRNKSPTRATAAVAQRPSRRNDQPRDSRGSPDLLAPCQVARVRRRAKETGPPGQETQKPRAWRAPWVSWLSGGCSYITSRSHWSPRLEPLGILTYVMTMDEAVQPGGKVQEPAPAASGL